MVGRATNRSSDPITLAEVYQARRTIAASVRRTPLVPSPSLSARAGGAVYLKLESLQDTGSFKLRGATNRLMRLDDGERQRGVITMSTGNHGRAVAFAAQRLGVRAVVCVSAQVPANKVEAIRALGAELRVVGQSQDEAQAEAERLAAEHGLVLVPPFDDRHIIAGQGSIGLELVEELPELDTVLVPVSGGGLIGGIAIAVRAAARARVVGVSMRRGAAMHASLAAGRPVTVAEEPSLADSLAGGIGLQNRYTLALVRDLVDDLVLVSEAEIAAAMRHAFREERLVVEGAGVVGLAAILTGRCGPVGRCTAVVVSGRNVDTDLFLEVVGGDRAGAGGAA
jgi:threonine dehydratase